jgi:hypothetical protein
MDDPTTNPSPQRPAGAAQAEPAPPPPVRPEDVQVPESVATGRDNPQPEREPVVGNRDAGGPASEPAGEQASRADEGRQDDSRRQTDARPSPSVNPFRAGQGLSQPRAFDPHTANPGRLHGARDRLRQDEGLRPDDVVELSIRPGQPEGGWVDFPAAEGLDELRARKEPIGANSQGINLIAGMGEGVDSNILRELRASTIPARLVRRPREAQE